MRGMLPGLVLLCACAGPGGTSGTTTRSATGTAPGSNGTATATAHTVSRTGAAARELGRQASYGELVRLAKLLLRGGHGDSDAGCLLTRHAGGIRLSADLMSALQTPPDPAPKLAALMRDHLGPVRVLTGWGMAGRGAGVALATLTSTPPASARGAFSAVVLTEAGIFLRHGERDASPSLDGPLAPEAVAARITQLDRAGASGRTRFEGASAQALRERASPPTPLDSGSAHALLDTGSPRTLHVAAESTVAVEDLAALLAVLPGDRTVALAVVLPAGTELPADATRASAAAPSCPDGLPPVPDSEALGDMSPEAARAGLLPLRAAALDCLSAARSGGGAGGQLRLSLRVGENGRVLDACLRDDPIGDPLLGVCVVTVALDLLFAAPSPTGVVDLEQPLLFTPQTEAPRRALCP